MLTSCLHLPPLRLNQHWQQRTKCLEHTSCLRAACTVNAAPARSVPGIAAGLRIVPRSSNRWSSRRTVKVDDRGDAEPSLPMLVVRSSDGAKLPNDVVRSIELRRLSPASPPACRAASCALCRRMCLLATNRLERQPGTYPAELSKVQTMRVSEQARSCCHSSYTHRHCAEVALITCDESH